MIENRYSRRALASARARTDVARQNRRRNPLVVLLALLALAVQLFVVQTHVHVDGTPPAAVALSGDHASGAASQGFGDSRDHSPIKDDPSNCPLCQEFAHSGHFLQSAQILLLLPASVSAPGIFLGETLHSLSLLSHSWQGRAPPQR